MLFLQMQKLVSLKTQYLTHWTVKVFPSSTPGSLLAPLLSSTLSSLDPSPQFCLEAAAKLSPELELLQELKASTDNFIGSLGEVLAGAGEAELHEVGMAAYLPYRGGLARCLLLNTHSTLCNTTSLSTDMGSWRVGLCSRRWQAGAPAGRTL